MGNSHLLDLECFIYIFQSVLKGCLTNNCQISAQLSGVNQCEDRAVAAGEIWELPNGKFAYEDEEVAKTKGNKL